MKKIQCPNIEKGDNVHDHYCYCCEGKQHVPMIVVLKYQLRGLLVLDDQGKRDASDQTMHQRISDYIAYFKEEHKYEGRIDFTVKSLGEPISTLNACIDTIRFD